jgi:hypothetical protein
MDRWLLFGAGALAVLASIGFVGWSLMPRQRIPPVDATFEELDPDLPAIRIQGTAHYRGVIIQRSRSAISFEPETMYVYGLFPVGDTEGREVRILVRTDRRPAARVDFEYVEVEGFFDAPRPHTLPFGSEEQMAGANYFFHPDVRVLTAWDIRTIDPILDTPR